MSASSRLGEARGVLKSPVSIAVAVDFFPVVAGLHRPPPAQRHDASRRNQRMTLGRLHPSAPRPLLLALIESRETHQSSFSAENTVGFQIRLLSVIAEAATPFKFMAVSLSSNSIAMTKVITVKESIGERRSRCL